MKKIVTQPGAAPGACFRAACKTTHWVFVVFRQKSFGGVKLDKLQLAGHLFFAAAGTVRMLTFWKYY